MMMMMMVVVTNNFDLYSVENVDHYPVFNQKKMVKKKQKKKKLRTV